MKMLCKAFSTLTVCRYIFLAKRNRLIISAYKMLMKLTSDQRPFAIFDDTSNLFTKSFGLFDAENVTRGSPLNEFLRDI